MIKFLTNGEIDRKKWDACIMNSRQKLVYSMSWYLDLVARQWDGLVEDDYRSVMALPVRKKWGIKYVYQPVYSQQLGINAPYLPGSERIEEFIRAIPAEYRYIHYNFSSFHDFSKAAFPVSKRINYELRLNHSYQDIESGYSENTRRNINKSLPHIELSEKVSIPELIRLKRTNNPIKREPSFYEWMNFLMNGVISRGKGFLVGAYHQEELVAASFFIFFAGRIYYLIPVSNEKGRNHRAMFAILDYVIGKYADTGLVLDFEGSGIRGIARFFAGFGAKPTNYYMMVSNRLPWFLKLLKR